MRLRISQQRPIGEPKNCSETFPVKLRFHPILPAMVSSSIEVDESAMPQDNWGPQEDQPMGPSSSSDPPNGPSLPADDNRTAGQGADNADFHRGSSAGDVAVSEGKGDTYREKQVKVLRSLCSVNCLSLVLRLLFEKDPESLVVFSIGPVSPPELPLP